MEKQGQSVVRLSLRWILFGGLCMVALGVGGGFIGSAMFKPSIPLVSQPDQLVTTVQQVTVSPNTHAQSVVGQKERSVLLLASGNRSNPTIIGTGSVVTNDGVLIGFHAQTRDEVFAIDTNGVYILLESIGRDALYGITLYRARDVVLAPFDLDSADPGVGTTLLAMARSTETTKPIAKFAALEQYILPPADSPQGWGYVGMIEEDLGIPAGSPLLADDGRLAALYVGDGTQAALPVSYVRRSLERLAGGKREYNPFDEYGFTAAPSFAAAPSELGIELSFVVTSVAANSTTPVRAGDRIARINDQELAWGADIANLLSAPAPVGITVIRSGQEQTFSLSPLPAP